MYVSNRLTFSQSNSRHKRVKFDLIFNKNIRLQFQEDVKDDILESLVFNCNIEDNLDLSYGQQRYNFI